MFQKLALRTKLLLLCGGLSASLLFVGLIDHFTLAKVSDAAGHVTSINLKKLQLCALIRFQATDFARNYLKLYVLGKSPSAALEIKKQISENMTSLENAKLDYLKLPVAPGEEELSLDEERSWKLFRDKALRLVELHGANDPKLISEAYDLMAIGLPGVRNQHAASINKLLDFQNIDSAHWVQNAQDASHTGSLFSWILCIASFALALGGGWMFSNHLSRDLQTIAEKLSTGANQVATASRDVSSSSVGLSSAATEQAASLQQTSAAIEEMSSMINKNADNAAQSQKISQQSQKAAEQGQSSIINMLKSMDEITLSNSAIMEQINESNQRFAEVIAVIVEIGNKTKVINEIVFQTKLLSFNASVEAARAGEHGKGFAVVADEVGNLARMSGAAAQEISNLLDGSIKKVEGIVSVTKAKVGQLIQTGKEKVETGLKVANQCSQTFEDMNQSIQKVSGMISEIATASHEQAIGVKEINQAVGQLDTATQQNASTAQQTSGSAEVLSSQSASLRSLVLELMYTIDGESKSSKSATEKT